ncbi:MAG: hypothetical protein ACKVW3_04075 [Phycisphaerales bacterium]
MLRPGLLAALAVCPACVAQTCFWTNANVNGPSARYGHAMAYDSTRGVVVLFGGSASSTSSSSLSDTWEWNGSAWTLRASGGTPARTSMKMTFDSARKRTVMFGGYTASGANSGETWEWDGSAWTLAATTGPLRRYAHGLTYDSHRGRTVLHGGTHYTSTVYIRQRDTWEWNGAAWTLVFEEGPLRSSHALTFDSSQNRTVLYGGSNESGFLTSETWEWDGMSWLLAGTAGPSLSSPALAYDTIQNRTILAAGWRPQNTHDIDTWERIGATWLKRANTGPLSRSSAEMVFDAARGRLVLFGGLATLYPGGSLAGTWIGDANASAPFLVITQHPVPTTVAPAQTTMLSVAATGAGDLTYQWRRQGVNLVEGGSYSGTRAATLTISPAECHMVGTFDAIVSDACGSAQSASVMLTVTPCPYECYANCDSSTVLPFLNVNDFICFNENFAAGCSGQPVCYANCDQSTIPPILNVLDFVCFNNLFAAGCS